MTKEAREQFSKIIKRFVKSPENLSNDLIDYIENCIRKDTGIPIPVDVHFFLGRYYIKKPREDVKEGERNRGRYLSERQISIIDEIVELLLMLNVFEKEKSQSIVVESEVVVNDKMVEALSQRKLDLKKEGKI